MATAITADPQPEAGRIVVTVDGPQPGEVVERQAGNGAWQQGRYAVVKDDAMLRVLVDYEAPLDMTVTYRVVGGPVSTPIVLTSGGMDWWKPLPYPSLSMPVNVVDGMQETESATESQTLFPLGSTTPVLVTGARRSWKGTLTIATVTGGEAARFLEGIKRSPLALFQPAYQAQIYLAIGATKRRRLSRLRNDPGFLWAMDVQEIATPALVWSYPAAATWDAYRDSATTWQDWQGGGTWLDVLLGVPLPVAEAKPA